MIKLRLILLLCALGAAAFFLRGNRLIQADGGESSESALSPYAIPPVGFSRLTILSPNMLELFFVDTAESEKDIDPSGFLNEEGQWTVPAMDKARIRTERSDLAFLTVGFKRRVLYAPLKKYDLRIGNYLYFQLRDPIPEGATVTIDDPERQLGRPQTSWQATADPARVSPVIHVNQSGYHPQWSKKAMVGYYLGTLGELNLRAATSFRLVDEVSKAVVFTGALSYRADRGFTLGTLPYQEVMEADFSAFQTSGVYRLAVDGLGASEPFSIHDGAPAVLARSYALGLYHQRCGAANAAPYTRFIHDPCHTAPAQIPTNDHEKVNAFLQTMSEDDDPAMVPLSALGASYYPIRKQGELDVSGGHHDAGDYSKYTIHSAHFIHALMIGVDALDGVGDLDNLGLPESGDGVGDLMQMAMWEADFLSKMQDEDGGFFFLVYPRARRYESDVLPDKGDLQVVFPKNTAATGAAVAALAQIASSPRFKTAFPEKAARYLDQARKGWDFLIQAEARFGVGETYQRISHYGNLFGDADEYVWAAAELFLATGDAAYHRFLMSRFDPSDRRTRRWGWQRMVEGYGNAVRSYALAPETGRQRPSELDERYYRLCRDEAVAAAQEQVDYADGNAYGISFPFESKRFMNAGWFLAMDAGFDIVMGNALHPETPWMESLLTNVNYEAGANPNNMTYITGLGFRFPREIVHQYAQNDDRVLPPSGIPFGNIQAGFEAHKPYQKLLSALTFPPDDDRRAPYPLFDRWADAFNTRTEATMVKQARALTGYAWLMARTPLKNQPWRPAEARIVNMPEKPQAGKTYTLRLEADGLALDEAVIIWETSDREPVRGHAFALTAPRLGQGRIEAEAYLPDGRRVFARMDYQVGWW